MRRDTAGLALAAPPAKPQNFILSRPEGAGAESQAGGQTLSKKTHGTWSTIGISSCRSQDFTLFVLRGTDMGIGTVCLPEMEEEQSGG